MVEAQRAGIGQGELQAGLSSLNAISHVLAPLVMDEHTMFLLLFLTKTHHVFDAHY